MTISREQGYQMINVPDPEERTQVDPNRVVTVPWTQQWINAAQAYQAAQIHKASDTEPKEVLVEEKFEGGWRCEGKEKPVTPLVCPRCQWARKNAQQTEPDNKDWCESCVAGVVLGNDPDKSYRPPPPSATDLNKTFFG